MDIWLCHLGHSYLKHSTIDPWPIAPPGPSPCAARAAAMQRAAGHAAEGPRTIATVASAMETMEDFRGTPLELKHRPWQSRLEDEVQVMTKIS